MKLRNSICTVEKKEKLNPSKIQEIKRSIKNGIKKRLKKDLEDHIPTITKIKSIGTTNLKDTVTEKTDGRPKELV